MDCKTCKYLKYRKETHKSDAYYYCSNSEVPFGIQQATYLDFGCKYYENSNLHERIVIKILAGELR